MLADKGENSKDPKHEENCKTRNSRIMVSENLLQQVELQVVGQYFYQKKIGNVSIVSDLEMYSKVLQWTANGKPILNLNSMVWQYCQLTEPPVTVYLRNDDLTPLMGLKGSINDTCC